MWFTDRFLFLFGSGENFGIERTNGANPHATVMSPIVREVWVYDFLTGGRFSAYGPPIKGRVRGISDKVFARPPFQGMRSIDPNDGREIAWREIATASGALASLDAVA